MRVAIMQPFFFPWIGYYELIASVDCFIMLDDVELSKQSWQTRNVFTAQSSYHWRSVPLKGSSITPLNEVGLHNPEAFVRKLNSQIKQNISHENYELIIKQVFEKFHENMPQTLFDLNHSIISNFVELFQIETKIIRSSTVEVDGTRDWKIINLLKSVGATGYLAAPGSRNYIQDFGLDLYPVDVTFFEYQKSKDISIFHDGYGYENSMNLVNRLGLERVIQNVFR